VRGHIGGKVQTFANLGGKCVEESSAVLIFVLNLFSKPYIKIN